MGIKESEFGSAWIGPTTPIGGPPLNPARDGAQDAWHLAEAKDLDIKFNNGEIAGTEEMSESGPGRSGEVARLAPRSCRWPQW